MSLPAIDLQRAVTLEGLQLVDSVTGQSPHQPTRLSLRDDGEALVVRFEAADDEPWATRTGRDDDLWREEVVEVFLAPGGGTPTTYFEIELNPAGALFDARIESPHGDRRELRVDRDWTCRDLRADVEIEPRMQWTATLTIPWRSIDPTGHEPAWRANFFRIDRPRAAPPEFSAWSPTRVAPADFHRPACFGFLRRMG